MPDDNRSQQATLGCGTLILIGLVVMFFSRPGLREIEEELRALRTEVKTLQKTVNEQTELLKKLPGNQGAD